MSQPAQTVLPRWRGFNLLEMFTTRSDGAFREDDLRWMSDWGFDFVRLPMCYLLWVKDDDPYSIHEPMLHNVDRVIEWADTYGLHVSLNFHRAPGYSVNRERQEPFNLWKDQEALDAFCFHWELFARRYKAIDSGRLSFDLVNEPCSPSEEFMTRADHERVVRAAVGAIHAVDAERLIIADGLSWGNDPLPELADLGIGQSCRAYVPAGISHYKASWVDSKGWLVPGWPGQVGHGEYWDRARLGAHYEQWADLARKGVGVHCGEGGAFNKTPHDIFLAWFRDVLQILTAHNIGYALWNFRGPFGILESERADVDYEDWHGHPLDRELLDLLAEF